LIVVNAFKIDEPKTKQFRQALNALKVDKTVLVVEDAKADNRNLELSSRNIDGLELVRGHEVHPYHLLRYDRVIFSQPAIEKLQLSLKNAASKRQREAAAETEPQKKTTPRKRARRQAAEVA
jgi:large subunit ribosomal protein L4